jgi:hypothetical protein
VALLMPESDALAAARPWGRGADPAIRVREGGSPCCSRRGAGDPATVRGVAASKDTLIVAGGPHRNLTGISPVRSSRRSHSCRMTTPTYAR